MKQSEKTIVDFMESRRSVRSRDMHAPAPDADQLAHILKLACRVPDHGKLAPWRFIVFSADDQVQLGHLALQLAEARSDGPDLTEAMKEDERLRFLRAPCVVAVVAAAKAHPKIPVWEQHLSAGAVCYAMLMAANASGFASQWLTGWVAYDAEIMRHLNVAEDEKIAGFIHMGSYNGPPPEDRPRPTVADITQYGLKSAD